MAAEQLVAVFGSPTGVTVAEPTLEDLNSALPFAELSLAIYECKAKCTNYSGKEGDWQLILESKNWINTHENGVLKVPFGFHAAAYRNVENFELAIVYEGTDPNDFKDLATDFSQPLPLKPQQYSHALEFAKSAIENYCPPLSSCPPHDIVVTGHSLGGGLAQYVALKLGHKAYIFNSAGLWGSTAKDIDTDVAIKAEIYHFRSQGDKSGQESIDDLVSQTGVQFPQKMFEIPVVIDEGLSIKKTIDAVHEMEKLQNAMFDLRDQFSDAFKSKVETKQIPAKSNSGLGFDLLPKTTDSTQISASDVTQKTFDLDTNQAKITGIVKDQFGDGIPGVHIRIVNTGFETTTDSSGEYGIGYVPGKISLQYSKKGYTTHHLNFELYTKDSLPAAPIEMWKIPSEGLYIVDRVNKTYIPITKDFLLSVRRWQSGSPFRPWNNEEFSAKEIGDLRVLGGEIEIINSRQELLFLFKRSEGGVVVTYENDAVLLDRKVNNVNEVTTGKVREIGDEKLKIRSVVLVDGAYLFVEYANTGLGRIYPNNKYYPFVVGNYTPLEESTTPLDQAENGNEANQVASNNEVNQFEHLALFYSPIIYQHVDTTESDGVEDGRADFIMNFNYDDNWSGADQWDNLSKFTGTSNVYEFTGTSTVYYSVKETTNYYFIYYAIYHPRDWTTKTSESMWFSHENDMEAITLMVQKKDQGTIPIAAMSMSHNAWVEYPLYKTIRARNYDGTTHHNSDGVTYIQYYTKLDNFPPGKHPRIYIQSKGHGIFMDADSNTCLNAGASGPDNWIKDRNASPIDNWNKKGFPGDDAYSGTGVVYYPNKDNKGQKITDPGSNIINSGDDKVSRGADDHTNKWVKYELVPLKVLLEKSSFIENNDSFEPMMYTIDDDNYEAFNGPKLGDSKARPPWTMPDQMIISNCIKFAFGLGEKISIPGEIFNDPKTAFPKHFSMGNDSPLNLDQEDYVE